MYICMYVCIYKRFYLFERESTSGGRSGGKAGSSSASADIKEPHVQVCHQQIPVHTYAQNHKHMGTLPQHCAQSHCLERGRTAAVNPLP